MKNFIIVLNVAIMLWVTSIFSADNSGETTDVPIDPKTQLAAGIGIERKETQPPVAFSTISTSSIVSREVLDFVREATEARVLDMEHGKMAQQRATNRALKDYATLMVGDQSRMLEDLRTITEKKSLDFSIPGDYKSVESKDLKMSHGKYFDDKFIKMMIADHRRDVKKFEKALSSSDPDIQVFATKYLNVVKSHLDKIKTIGRN